MTSDQNKLIVRSLVEARLAAVNEAESNPFPKHYRQHALWNKAHGIELSDEEKERLKQPFVPDKKPKRLARDA